LGADSPHLAVELRYSVRGHPQFLILGAMLLAALALAPSAAAAALRLALE
jgi:hypothetical protein